MQQQKSTQTNCQIKIETFESIETSNTNIVLQIKKRNKQNEKLYGENRRAKSETARLIKMTLY